MAETRPTDPQVRTDLRVDVRIEAGEQQQIQLWPQRVTRAQRLVWDGDIAHTRTPEGLILESLSVGADQQLVKAIPLSDLTEVDWCPLDLPTCEPGMAITFSLRNDSDRAVRCAFHVEGLERS